MPVPAEGTIFFEFKMEGQGGSCDGPDQVNEGIFLQYNVGRMARFTANQAPFSSNPLYTNELHFIPPGNGNPLLLNTILGHNILSLFLRLLSANTQFRWFQPSPTSTSWTFGD